MWQHKLSGKAADVGPLKLVTVQLKVISQFPNCEEMI